MEYLIRNCTKNDIYDVDEISHYEAVYSRLRMIK